MILFFLDYVDFIVYSVECTYALHECWESRQLFVVTSLLPSFWTENERKRRRGRRFNVFFFRIMIRISFNTSTLNMTETFSLFHLMPFRMSSPIYFGCEKSQYFDRSLNLFFRSITKAYALRQPKLLLSNWVQRFNQQTVFYSHTSHEWRKIYVNQLVFVLYFSSCQIRKIPLRRSAQFIQIEQEDKVSSHNTECEKNCLQLNFSMRLSLSSQLTSSNQQITTSSQNDTVETLLSIYFMIRLSEVVIVFVNDVLLFLRFSRSFSLVQSTRVLIIWPFHYCASCVCEHLRFYFLSWTSLAEWPVIFIRFCT